MADRRLSDTVRRGFTLFEVMVASVLLVMTAAAISQAIVTGQTLTHRALHSERASVLAEALMAEIVSLPYHDPQAEPGVGPDTGESTRLDFDNSDDFHGYTEATGNLKDARGIAYPGEFSRFSRSVVAAYESITVTGYTRTVDGLTVTITVQDDRGQTWVMKRFIAEP